MTNPSVSVRVEGEYACFSRPEMKVERVSYEVITPSAARGILDSILWKPEMRWHVTRIQVLKPIRFIALKRNEVQSKVTVRGSSGVLSWMSDPSQYRPQMAGAGSDDVTQRNTLALRDVAYIITAEPIVHDQSGDNTPQKYAEMFNRRVKKGQCHSMPALGCREFVAEFCAPNGDLPIDYSRDLGMMLYDIIFDPAGDNRPVFFRGKLERGTLDTRIDHVIEDPELRREVMACSYKR